MSEPIFREKSLQRLTSPEELGEYLRVTNPSVWIVLIAVILMLVGTLIWSASYSIDSFVPGTAQVEDGSMRVFLDDAQLMSGITPGMTVKVGETESRITGIGVDADGNPFAAAPASLADGVYPASVILRRTQILKLLFN